MFYEYIVIVNIAGKSTYKGKSLLFFAIVSDRFIPH